MQTNPAVEQNKNIKWPESPWNQSGRKGKGWQVTLCDPIWHVSSRSGDGRLACKLLYPSLLLLFLLLVVLMLRSFVVHVAAICMLLHLIRC